MRVAALGYNLCTGGVYKKQCVMRKKKRKGDLRSPCVALTFPSRCWFETVDLTDFVSLDPPVHSKSTVFSLILHLGSEYPLLPSVQRAMPLSVPPELLR